MKCEEKNCEGEIDETNEFPLRIGCFDTGIAMPCSDCGRLHWKIDGSPVFNRPGDKVFLEKGKTVHRDKNNQLVGC